LIRILKIVNRMLIDAVIVQKFDAGERTVVAILKTRGISKLDFFIDYTSTHCHLEAQGRS